MIKKTKETPYKGIMPCFKANRNLLVIRQARRKAQVDKALGKASEVAMNIMGVLVIFAIGLLTYVLLA